MFVSAFGTFWIFRMNCPSIGLGMNFFKAYIFASFFLDLFRWAVLECKQTELVGFLSVGQLHDTE